MIEKLRKNLNQGEFSFKKIVAIFLFAAIALVFVLFGYQTESGTGAGYVARVNSSFISTADLKDETQRLEQMYQQFFGGNFNMGNQREQLEQTALANLVQTELVNQAAQNEKLFVSDSEIRHFITKEIPAFQKDGQFQREYYENYVRYIGSSAGLFETKIRKQKQLEKTQKLFELVSQPNSLEMAKINMLKQQKLNLQFLKIDKDELKKAYKVDSKRLTESIANPDFYKRVESFYKDNMAQFSEKEQVSAQHILVKDQKTADEIKAKVNAQNFSDLAKKHSEDPGSKTKGGDLGNFVRGQMVAAFEEAAFKAEVGQIVGPIKTDFGYHIIKVNSKKAASQKTLDEVKDQIAKELLSKEELDKLVTELESALKEKSYEQIDAISQKMGTKWEETGYFALDQDNIPKLTSPVVIKEAYGLTAQNMYSGIVRDGGVQYVLKYKDSKLESNVNAKDAKKDAKKDIEPENNEVAIARERAFGLFRSWVDSYKSKSEVSYHQTGRSTLMSLAQ